MLVAVPQLSIGNFASVLRMVERAGSRASLITEATALRRADKIILAGVGAFDGGMKSLEDGRWVEELNDAVVRRGVPTLGICLGMQLMCNGSEEGSRAGLGWIDAYVRKLTLPPASGYKVPHMGWNTVSVVKPNPLIKAEAGEPRFYFVHSYHVECNRHEDVVAKAHYGSDITVALNRDNIFGVQFHPEKSHRFGLGVITRFAEL